jgi:PIN domain nuclease of toxin-antitoxin system
VGRDAQQAAVIALLDTHALIWWVSGDKRLPRSHKRVIKAASAERPLLVAQISLWEIAMLVTFDRIRLDRPLRDWLEAATAPPLVETVGITPAVMGATLLTVDERIVDAKLVPTLS